MPASRTHVSNNVLESRQRHHGAELHRQQQRVRRDVHLGLGGWKVSRGRQAQQRTHADGTLRVRGR